MSLNPIRLTDIESYVRLYRVDDVEEFVIIIQQMDSAYLAKMNKDIK